MLGASSAADKQLVTIQAKEYTKYKPMVADDFIDSFTVSKVKQVASESELTVPSSMRTGKKSGSIPNPEVVEETETLVQLRKSHNYMAFPQYKIDASATSTILPAIFLPTKMKAKPQTTTVRFPPIVNRESYDCFPQKMTSRKKTFRKNEAALSAVQELTMTPSSEQQSARRSKSKRNHLHVDDDKSDIINLHPKIIWSHCDENNFSVKNISETQPGTVKLSIYYHEPSKGSVSVLSSGEGSESPTSKQQQQQIKGMIFDKTSRCYYPADSGRQTRKNSPRLADIVFFKLNDHSRRGSNSDMNGGKQQPATTRLRLLNAARKRLLRNRNESS